MALVLSRKQHQSITIGEAVITIERVRGGRVTVSVQAPKEMRVLRGELKPKEAA